MRRGRQLSAAVTLALGIWLGAAECRANDDAPEPGEKLESVAVRVSLDHSSLYWLRDHHGEVSANGIGGVFDEVGMESGTAWGGRVRVGWAATRYKTGDGGLAHLEVAAGRPSTERFSTNIAGVDYIWEAQPTYWSAAVGGEGQFLARVLGLGLSLGLAGVVDRPTPLAPPTLEMENVHKWGLFAEVSTVIHIPGYGGFHPGIGTFVSGFVAPKHPFSPGVTRRGARFGLVAFVEWDRTRK